MKTIQDLLTDLSRHGGAIVSSTACSEMELAFAKKEDRFAVCERGFGFVRRLQEWLDLQKAHEAAAADSKAPESAN